MAVSLVATTRAQNYIGGQDRRMRSLASGSVSRSSNEGWGNSVGERFEPSSKRACQINRKKRL
jgi:hypothetical protein